MRLFSLILLLSFCSCNSLGVRKQNAYKKCRTETNKIYFGSGTEYKIEAKKHYHICKIQRDSILESRDSAQLIFVGLFAIYAVGLADVLWTYLVHGKDRL